MRGRPVGAVGLDHRGIGQLEDQVGDGGGFDLDRRLRVGGELIAQGFHEPRQEFVDAGRTDIELQGDGFFAEPEAQ